MAKFLNLDGAGIYTSARDKGDGTPVTDVVAVDRNGNPLPVTTYGEASDEKPTNAIRGDRFVVLGDTGIESVHIYTGKKWVEI